MSMPSLVAVLAICSFQVAFALCADDDADGTGIAAAAVADTCMSAFTEIPGDIGVAPIMSSLLQMESARETAFPAQTPGCSWAVFYNKWIPTFDAGEYEHVGNLGGAHCLTACCQDSTCKGIALMSDETYQCYKYSRLPAELGLETSQALGDGQWMGQLNPAWSIFAKAGGATAPPLLSVTPLQPAKSARKTACEWEVHYDLWLDTFTRGEYEPANSFGGQHCLTACCHDPTCEGLALMSNEEYQCYEYKGLPKAVAAHEGVPLGNGMWLSQKKPAWSVFVKTRSPPAAGVHKVMEAPLLLPMITPQSSVSNSLVVDPSAPLLPSPIKAGPTIKEAPKSPVLNLMSPARTVFAAILASLLNMVVLAVCIAALAFTVLHFTVPDSLPGLAKTLSNLRGDPEARKLLEGINLNSLSEMSDRQPR